MRKLAVAALIAVLVGHAAVSTPAWAVECTFVAPLEPARDPGETADRAPDTSATGRSGSAGPARAPPGRERSQARDRDDADGGPGSQRAPQQAAQSPRLDVDAFTTALDRRFRTSTAGYVMQLRQHGAPLRTKSWRWARGPRDGGLTWDADRRMHVASISKLVTAIAMVRLLDDKGIDASAKIIDYLPQHWRKGPGIDQITFAQLLRHESGFDTGTYYADYRFMQRQVAKGVTGAGAYRYQNINFGLARVLIPIINGDLRTDAALADEAWDDQTLAHYAAYVQRAVFAPSGVTGATLVRPPAAALAYTYQAAGKGWDSGKLTCAAGAAAWFMSANEVLDVLGTFRRHGTIVPAQRAQALLQQRFGIDRIGSVGAASFYVKSGAWWDGSRQRMEQSVAYVLPEDMELVVFVNSPIGADNDNLTAVVSDIYRHHLSYH